MSEKILCETDSILSNLEDITSSKKRDDLKKVLKAVWESPMISKETEKLF
jgi:hypothetical protein